MDRGGGSEAGNRVKKEDSITKLAAPQAVFRVFVVAGAVGGSQSPNLVPNAARGRPNAAGEELEVPRSSRSPQLHPILLAIPRLPEKAVRRNHLDSLVLDARPVQVDDPTSYNAEVRRPLSLGQGKGQPGGVCNRVVVVKDQEGAFGAFRPQSAPSAITQVTSRLDQANPFSKLLCQGLEEVPRVFRPAVVDHQDLIPFEGQGLVDERSETPL